MKSALLRYLDIFLVQVRKNDETDRLNTRLEDQNYFFFFLDSRAQDLLIELDKKNRKT